MSEYWGPINPNDNLDVQHLTYIGKSGSGKTYTAKKDVENLGLNRIVYWDPDAVHKTSDVIVVTHIVDFVHELIALERSGKPYKLMLKVEHCRESFDAFCGAVRDFASDGEHPLGPLGVVCEELPQVVPPGPIKDVLPNAAKLYLVGRKYNNIIVSIGQRFALLSKDIISQSRRIWMGQTMLPNDAKAISSGFGIAYDDVIGLGEYCAYVFDAHANENRIKLVKPA